MPLLGEGRTEEAVGVGLMDRLERGDLVAATDTGTDVDDDLEEEEDEGDWSRGWFGGTSVGAVEHRWFKGLSPEPTL